MKRGLKICLAAVPVIGIILLTALISVLKKDREAESEIVVPIKRPVLKGPPYFTRILDPKQ